MDLRVFDTGGRLMRTASLGALSPGVHEIPLEFHFSPGLYTIVSISEGSFASSRLVVLAR